MSSHTRFRWISRFAALLVVILLAGGSFWWVTAPGPYPETEIFQGVYYTALELPETNQTAGLAHIVRVDLTAPGIGLYFTPLDSKATEQGRQYRLRYPWRVARSEDLAVTVNGTLFRTDARWYLPMQPVDGTHTVVSDGVVSHMNQQSAMLWFDDDLTPHLTRERPPPADVLQQARWGIGAGEVVLRDGQPRPGTGQRPNRRTMMAIDADRQLLWLATFEHTSYNAAAEILAEEGARDGIMLDGGGSTTMHISRKAMGRQKGTLIGGWRPVATHVGIRAEPLE